MFRITRQSRITLFGERASTRRAILTTMVVVALMVLYTLTLSAGKADARAVSLSDAICAPMQVAYLLPGESYAAPMHGISDVGAYRWDGSALADQRRYGTSYTWRGSKGSVRYNRNTNRFLNRTNAPVLVAVWEG